MTIDNETVKKVASLSKLKIEDHSLEETKEGFNKILNWVAQLEEVDVTDVAPLVSVHEENLVWREDIVCDGNLKDEVLKNAPMSEFGYIAVPKVVE